MDVCARISPAARDRLRPVGSGRAHLAADARVAFVHTDAADFLQQAEGHGGVYVIDDMDPQPNWPPGHATKVAGLLARLEADARLRITKLTWASGIVIALKVAG
jgi:hypothetical protein